MENGGILIHVKTITSALVCVGLLATSISFASEPDIESQLEQWSQYRGQDRAALREQLINHPDLLPALHTRLQAGKGGQTQIGLLDAFAYEEVANLLALALRSDNSFVRTAACRVIARIGDCRGVSLLEEALTNLQRSEGEPALRRVTRREVEEIIQITRALNLLNCVEGIRTLMPLLEHPSHIVRLYAADGLARHGNTAAVPTLIALLEEGRDYTGSTCGMGVVPTNYRATRTLESLTYQTFADPNTLFRRSGNIEIFIDPSPQTDEVRTREEKLAHHRAMWTAWWEENASRSREEWRKDAYAWASRAIDVPSQRRRAVRRLGLVGDDQVMLFLHNYLERRDVEPEAYVLIMRTLHNLNTPGFSIPNHPSAVSPEALLRHTLASHSAAEVRMSAARALSNFRSQENVDLLIEALADEPVTATALQSLNRMRANLPTEWLIAYLDADNPLIQHQALLYLNRVATPEEEPLYIARLRNEENAQTLRNLLIGLRRIGSDQALSEIMPLIRHRDRSVRTSAVRVLEGIAGTRFDYRERGNRPDLEGRQRIDEWWAASQTAAIEP